MNDFPKYFDVPTQVKFMEIPEGNDTPCYLGGIAFGTSIICGCCGSIIELSDVMELKVLPWVSISNEIMGDD